MTDSGTTTTTGAVPVFSVAAVGFIAGAAVLYRPHPGPGLGLVISGGDCVVGARWIPSAVGEIGFHLVMSTSSSNQLSACLHQGWPGRIGTSDVLSRRTLRSAGHGVAPWPFLGRDQR